MFLNSIFKEAVKVNKDECFDGCTFVSGSVAKANGVFGLEVFGDADVTVKNCSFKNKGYSAVLMGSTGKFVAENCVVDCAGLKNPFEGSQEVSIGDTEIKGVVFEGKPGNNYVNYYNIKEGSKHVVENCSIANADCGNNIMRLSNRTNASATFELKDCSYTYATGTPDNYTGLVLCQDYTNKSGVKQNFVGYSIVIDNVSCNGEEIKTKPAVGNLYYVYEDGKGIITDNNPTVIVK